MTKYQNQAKNITPPIPCLMVIIVSWMLQIYLTIIRNQDYRLLKLLLVSFWPFSCIRQYLSYDFMIYKRDFVNKEHEKS